jgi:hypothetical protein
MGPPQHDRRRSPREIASRQVVLRSEAGQPLAKGLSTNVSSYGLFVVLRAAPDLPTDEAIVAEWKDPSADGAEQGVQTRRCRVVRRRQMGNLIGLGVEFLEPDD